MSADPLFMWGDLAMIAGAPAILLFVLFYGLRSRWEKSAVGRSVFTLAASLAAVYVLVGVTLWLGDFPGRGWIRLGVYSAVSTAMWVLFIVLLRTQHRGRHHS